MSSDQKSAVEISEAAAGWAQRLRSHGHLDVDALEAWLDADDRHAQALKKAEELLDSFDFGSGDPQLLKLRGEALRYASQKPSPNRWPTRRILLSSAAATFVAAVVAVTYAWPREQSYRTGTGEQRIITLADKSRVILDANSVIDVAFTRDVRRIELKSGRAHFEVAKDPSRPFKVHVGTKYVTAIGTAFTVEYRNAKVAVTLVEGRIAVADTLSDQSVTTITEEMKPQQQLTIADGSNHAVLKDNLDLTNVQGWQEGRLYFDDVTLAEAADRMNDYSSNKISIGDPKAANIRISGTFLAGQTDAFVEAIESAYPVKGVSNGSSVVIRSQGE